MKDIKLEEGFIRGTEEGKVKDKTVKWYLEAFEANDTTSGFIWKWSFGAFLFGWPYLLYRKCYGTAISFLVLVHLLSIIAIKKIPEYQNIISASNIFILMISGGFLQSFVYKRYINLKIEVEKKYKGKKEQLEAMKKYGGVNKKAVVYGVIGYLIANNLINYYL